MNERDFFYSEADAASGANPSEPVNKTEESSVPVADAMATTTDHSNDAAAADTQHTQAPTQTPVAESTESTQAQASTSATESAAPSPVVSDATASGSETSAPAPAAEESSKPAPVVITDEILARLQHAKDNSEIINVHVSERVRGGLRVLFENIKLFLPASQFYIKKTPTDDELQSVVGTDIPVQVFEIQKDDTGKISIIASRKNILKAEFLKNIKVGDTVEGVVSTIMPFGVFVDIGGFDGLIHISRISHQRVENPHNVFKRGDTVKAKIVEIDTEKDKIALSTKEFEESPWTTVEQDFAKGSRHTGTVRRITDFGAFVELKKGIEGLLRVSELSWTKRTGHPSEVVSVGQELEVMVVDASAEKKQVGLSIKRLSDSPWKGITDKFPVGAETTGVVKQVMGQGAVITIGGEFDGFMPRSKMRDVMRGKRIPYNAGDMVSVVIADINSDDESLILAPKVDPNEAVFGSSREGGREGGRDRRNRDDGDREPRARVPREAEAKPDSNFSLADLLSDTEKTNLFGKQ